ncbi:MAG: NapC/NirT family cytochrome c [Gammaproteobacteria bacterium]|nr:NapC/NirT family cytochrome c [Gammaproteobacteria bacterium]
MFGIPVGGVVLFVAGIVFWGGFNWAMELSNTEEFCISCHEMRDFVYEEYKQTIHYNNRTGVRAVCTDCHVPKEWIYKVVRKVKATNELYHKVLGTINTKEKFEAKRLELAENVWAEMRATDSRECRNCHSLEFMDLEAQDKSARKKHDAERWAERGETCIDCHDGIAHELPEES